jgi:hypothetical protein
MGTFLIEVLFELVADSLDTPSVIEHRQRVLISYFIAFRLLCSARTERTGSCLARCTVKFGPGDV